MEVELKSFDDLNKMFEESKRKRFFIFNWIDDVLFKEKSLFSYRPSYILFRPFLIIQEFSREVKYAWQRVYRGWDDTVPWSVDVWMNHMMPEILVRLKGERCFFGDVVSEGENGDYSDKQYKQAEKDWDKEIDNMIEGFKAAQKLNDLEYNWKDDDRKEEKELIDIYKRGMKSFVDNYFRLWS